MKNLNTFICEQLITERFVNCHNQEQMKQYAEDVWKIMTKSYEYCGGMAGMDSVQQLMDETTLWKLVRKEGKIVAAIVYNNKRGGRKACYCGTDGTELGVQCLKKIMQEDNLLPDRQAWGEFSGKAVSTMFNQGAMPVRAEVAQEIMKDKEFLEIKPDGYYYTRKIGGHPHTKLMMGNPRGKVEVPEEVCKELKALARKYDADEKTDQPIIGKNTESRE